MRFEIKDLKRDEFPEYPIEAYREAIVNAVIHFDYFLGDTIAVEKLKSSIIINNKGELLFPKSEFGKKSEARNRLLVDLLARTDFMEKAGTGIKRVTDACVKNGNKVNFEFSDSFWITMETNSAEKVGEKVGEKLTGNQLMILNQMRNDPYISAKVLAEKVGISVRKIETNIKKLKDFDYIKRVGPAKGGHWKVMKNAN